MASISTAPHDAIQTADAGKHAQHRQKFTFLIPMDCTTYDDLSDIEHIMLLFLSCTTENI